LWAVLRRGVRGLLGVGPGRIELLEQALDVRGKLGRHEVAAAIPQKASEALECVVELHGLLAT
jgi:hypothetical protein